MGSTVSKIVSPITDIFAPPKPSKPRTVIQSAAAQAPGRADAAVQEAAQEARRRRAGARGRASTIITSLTDGLPEGSVSRKQLLGGS